MGCNDKSFSTSRGDGLPSDVGGEGDSVRGVPNRNCGVVFVEDDMTRDGDDNTLSVCNR